MDSNLVKFLGEFENIRRVYHLESIIRWRFVALGSDLNDYYYITYDGRKLKWNTCGSNFLPKKIK
jgi:hypothetical protein